MEISIATQAEIELIIETIKTKRQNWRLSTRQKNLQALIMLGIDQDLALDEIYYKLQWRDYVSGPENDNHVPPIAGDVWVFGMIISEQICYLKFQNKPSGIIMWISVHPADYPLNFPYQ